MAQAGGDPAEEILPDPIGSPRWDQGQEEESQAEGSTQPRGQADMATLLTLLTQLLSQQVPASPTAPVGKTQTQNTQHTDASVLTALAASQQASTGRSIQLQRLEDGCGVEKYRLWEFRTIASLQEAGVWDAILHPLSDYDANDRLVTTLYSQQNSQIFNALLKVVPDSLARKYMSLANTDPERGKKAWEMIKPHFIKPNTFTVLDLNAKVAKFQHKPGETMEVFLNRADDLKQEHETLGLDFEDQHLVSVVYRALPGNWANVEQTMQMRVGIDKTILDWSWEDFSSVLRAEDTKRRTMKAVANNPFLPLGLERGGGGGGVGGGGHKASGTPHAQPEQTHAPQAPEYSSDGQAKRVQGKPSWKNQGPGANGPRTSTSPYRAREQSPHRPQSPYRPQGQGPPPQGQSPGQVQRQGPGQTRGLPSTPFRQRHQGGRSPSRDRPGADKSTWFCFYCKKRGHGWQECRTKPEGWAPTEQDRAEIRKRREDQKTTFAHMAYGAPYQQGGPGPYGQQAPWMRGGGPQGTYGPHVQQGPQGPWTRGGGYPPHHQS